MVETRTELLPILEQIEREKGIKKEGILKVIESALISAYKKHVGKNVRCEATIIPETAEVKAYVIKNVVENVVDSNLEISLNDARNISPDVKIGSEIKIPLDTQEFSRIAAQTAKQVIIQKIRESERSALMEEYKAKIGTVITGVVYRFLNNNVIIDLGKVEAILPYKEQVPKERFHIGEHVRVLVINVEQGARGVKVVVSRNRAEMIKKLFEMEVPEIYEKVVEIKNIAREPGIRTKMIVASHNPRVDPVGACVGVKGSRVKPIIDELRGEHIDLIPDTDDRIKLITYAFSPAKVLSINLNENEKRAEVIVPDDMLAVAIGKHGSNVNLVSRITEYSIDVKSETQKKEEVSQKIQFSKDMLTKIEGVGPKLADLLIKSGWDDINKIASAKVETLTAINNIGEKTAQKIILSAKKLIEMGTTKKDDKDEKEIKETKKKAEKKK